MSSKSEQVCYVTAFLDIGRDKWSTFKRTAEEYLDKFQTNLLKHFEEMDGKYEDNYELIVYLDDKHCDKIKPTRKNIKIVPINADSLDIISLLWSRLDREREISQSETYRKKFQSRLLFPENSVPEYSLINHAKIDLLVDAQQRSDAEYFCWVDFGYINFPKNPIDIKKLDTDRINYNQVNPLDKRDADVIYTILSAPERIGGGFFFGNRERLTEYQQIYHREHQWFQDNELMDDDQHLVIRCYLKRPALFRLHNFGGWFKHLKEFEKGEPLPRNKKVISFCLWGNKPIYSHGIIENVRLAQKFYPDWECWLYIHQPTVPLEVIEVLLTFPNAKVILKTENRIRPRRYMLWRFEPADDPTVERFMSRDSDSRITPREVVAVDEWVRTKRRLHIMRDHPQHFPKILGGMYGIVCDDHLNSIKTQSTWEKEVDLFYKYATEDTDDQLFLEKGIYGRYNKENRIIHDEIKRYEGGECRLFPITWGEDCHFIGCYVNPDGSLDKKTVDVLKRHLGRN